MIDTSHYLTDDDRDRLRAEARAYAASRGWDVEDFTNYAMNRFEVAGAHSINWAATQYVIARELDL
jgi:hypothetical protein